MHFEVILPAIMRAFRSPLSPAGRREKKAVIVGLVRAEPSEIA